MKFRARRSHVRASTTRSPPPLLLVNTEYGCEAPSRCHEVKTSNRNSVRAIVNARSYTKAAPQQDYRREPEGGVMALSNIVPEVPQISEKRRIERHYFNQFKDNYPLPSGTVDFGDKPDVIISGARRIGIEVTNFFVTDGRRADSVQRQRERRNAVVAEAQRLFQRATDRKRGFL